MDETDKKEKPESWDDKIYEIRRSADEAFNKLIVYLSSGALVLTIGFVQNVIDLPTAKFNELLIGSWILFTSSLLVILISYLTTVKSMDLELDKQKGKSNKWDKWDEITIFLNIASILTLVLGIILFIIFISINL